MHEAKHGARVQIITNSARNEKAKPLVSSGEFSFESDVAFFKRVVILSTTTWDQKKLRV